MKKLFVSIFMVSLLLLSTAQAWANAPATPEMTFQQAMEKAVANSKTLQSGDLNIDQAKQLRDNDSDNVKFIPTDDNPNQQAANAVTTLAQADLNWQIAKKNQDAQGDTVVMQVYQQYYGLLEAQEAVKVADLQLKSANVQRTVAAANARVGMLSQTGLIQAQSAADTAQSNLDAAKKSLDNAYQQFNQLVGLEANDRPVLTSAPDFTALKVEDLDTAVSRAIDTSPSVWTAEQQISLAKLALDLYVWNSSSTTYTATAINVNKAQVTAESTKDSLDKSVRSIYYNIKQLEEGYISAQQSVKVDEENLRVTNVKYDAGMVTEADVIAAEATLAKDKQTLLNNICQHDTLCYAFSKPWAYASAGTSGSSSSSSTS